LSNCDNFLARIAKVSKQQFPLGARLTLADLEGDVHPILHQLRTAEPVSWLPALDGWLVTSYDYATAVMRDAQTFTVDHPGFSTAQVVGPSMLSLDGEAHRQHRQPFERPFRRRAVDTRFTPIVTNLANDLFDNMNMKGQAELRRDLAGPLAVQTMMAALGLETTAVSQLLQWYDDIVTAVTRVTAGEPVSAEGQAAFAALRHSLLPALNRPAGDNLLAGATVTANDLSEEQIIANAAVLLFGGIETTEGMIANAFYFLLTNPDLLALVQSDPALLPAAIEETLRLEPAAAVVDRYAVRKVALGSAVIQSGDLVRVSLAGANRDPAIFDEPDRFDHTRPNLSAQVAFAQGPHVCLGLHLARLEARVAVGQALARLPGLRLAGLHSAGLHSAPTPQVRQDAVPRGLVFRKPHALHVIWNAP
jgi:cytochrome P450